MYVQLKLMLGFTVLHTGLHGGTKVSQIYLSQNKMTNLNFNKCAQSNLERGPRCGTVAHVRRKVPIGYNGAPQIHPQKYPFCGPISKLHYLLHPWTHLTLMPNGIQI